MRPRTRFLTPLAAWFTLACLAVLGPVPPAAAIPAKERAETPREEKTPPSPRKTVRGYMQSRPGGPMWDVEVEVHEVPDDLPSVPAETAPINDGDLVLGIVIDGRPMAYPIRFLAMFEVIDDRVGTTPVAPSW